MLTPVDVQNRVFKGGIGYDKKDVETFMSELASDYSELYRSNVELKDKVATLDESIQHYKSIEESMQKALTLSEKTAEETVIAANDKARRINNEAEKKAEMLLADAKEELQETKDEIYRLQKQQAIFKEQFTKVLEAQLKIMDGEMIDIDLGPGFEPSQHYEGGFGSFSGGGLGSEGGLGGLSGGGGYVGSSSFDDGRERTNQDPAFDRGTLNMDPFAEAANGGGRFSKQTGGAYNGSAGKKKASSKGSSEKSTLNVKESKPGSNRVKRNPQAVQQTQTNQNMNGAAAQPQQVKSQPAPQPQAAQPQQVKPQPAPQPQAAQPQQAKPQPAPQPQAVQPQQVKPQPAPQPQTAQPQQAKPQPTQRVKPEPQPVRTTANFVPEEELTQVTGEVEDRVNESNMLDSEDNYSTGFDFVSDDEQATASAVYDEDTVSGEVEERINESNMIDSEDNYNTGFDFVSDDDQAAEAYGGADEEETVSGEVEERINESNMIDSEDNYNTGFDFVSDDDMEETVSDGMSAASPTFEEADEDTYVGEVEDKVNESNMLDSADNYSDGFDFVVGNESEEEIPTILPNFAGGLGGGGVSDGLGSQSNDSASLHIDPFGETASTEEDVFVGDVEDNVKQSNLIGNADDEEEGFNFL
ncbi:MAG: DivIVA domain-containing protein [Lachnospiraceae bacterium]|nr:DivIVA domain-containing protein [Lachnospiraceae bacterium]